MQEVRTIRDMEAAWISNYHLSKNIRYISGLVQLSSAEH
jgi:hypothetical protein